MARLRLSTPDIRRAFLNGSRNAAREFGGQVYRAAVREAPRGSTGDLRRSLRTTTRLTFRGWAARVGSDLDYAKFVHDGTRKHVIRPRPPRKALRFTIDGSVVFAARVNHPGTKPNRFLDRALQQVARREGLDYRRGTGGGR